MDYRSENPPDCAQRDLWQLCTHLVAPASRHRRAQQQRQGGQGPSPALVPARMREQTRHVAHHLAHQRSCLERVEAPRLPTPTLEPTPFQDTEADDTACVYSLQIRTRGCGGSRIKTRTASFVWSDVFVLPPLHGKDCLGTRSSTSRTNSVASTSGLEDGEVVEPGSGSGSGSESVCVVRKPKREQSQPQTSTTDHVTGSYFPSVRPEPPLASNYDPTTPADFEPPSPTTVAQPGYHKAQMSKVLKRARKELMKGVRKAGYNALGVEGWELTVFRQNERCRIEVVYRARPAVSLSDSMEDMRVSHSPSYLSVLDE